VALRDYRDVNPRQPVDTGNKIECWSSSSTAARTAPASIPTWRRGARRCRPTSSTAACRWPSARRPPTTPRSTTRCCSWARSTRCTRRCSPPTTGRRRGCSTRTRSPTSWPPTASRPAKLWLDTFNSFGVGHADQPGDADLGGLQARRHAGVAIDGKWMTAPSMAGSRAATLPVMDYLVVLARKERAAKK